MWFPKCHCLKFVTDFITVTFFYYSNIYYKKKHIESNLANVCRKDTMIEKPSDHSAFLQYLLIWCFIWRKFYNYLQLMFLSILLICLLRQLTSNMLWVMSTYFLFIIKLSKTNYMLIISSVSLCTICSNMFCYKISFHSLSIWI